MFGPDNNVTEAEVRKVKLVRPERAKDHWKGTKHSDFVRMVYEVAGELGWKAVHEARFGLSPDEADLVICLYPKVPGVQPLPLGNLYTIGVSTSNALRSRLKVFSGITRLGVGMPFSMQMSDRKHTRHFDPQRELGELLSPFDGAKYRDGLIEAIEQLEEERLDDAEMVYNSTIIEAARAKLMPWSWIGVVDKQFRSRPSSEQTALNLFWHFAKVAQRNPVTKQMAQTMGFGELLPNPITLQL